MCGIAGLIDVATGVGPEVLAAMAARLARRGPDDQGIWRRDGWGLVHRRLSIIDLAGGQQPIFNEDESLAIVCNGELYDYQQWRTELETRGHRFRTQSDTEVLLHLYEEHGPACLESLNGMFAVAITHVASGRLFLARDRFGKKPLFYADPGDGRRFAFASGPAALAAVPWVDRSLDLIGIHDYLEYQYIPEPRSIYRGVRKFPAHSWGSWEPGGTLHIESFWEPRVTGDYSGGVAAARAELAARFEHAVKTRLVADVPVGLFLSGGLDSSTVCAVARQVTTTPLHTFSIGFPERKYDERNHAERVARHLGTEHHFLEVRANDFQRLRDLVGAYEEPFGDASMLPTSLLAEFTHQHVKVALSGDGADELFGGYERYQVMRWMQRLTVVPHGLRKELRRLLCAVLPPKVEERTLQGRLRRLVELSDADGLERYLALISRFPRSLRERVYGDVMREAVCAHRDLAFLEEHYRPHAPFVDGIMELDLKTYLNNDILVKVDRASMAFGLEVRCPFLDREVSELALRLPYRWKQAGRRRKIILADAFGARLPAGIAGRAKMGFGVPVARWLRHEWRAPVTALLLDGQGVKAGLFRREGINELLNEHGASRADHSYPLFLLTVLELWLQQAREP